MCRLDGLKLRVAIDEQYSAEAGGDYCGRQIAVPCAAIAVDTAFWFFTVQHQSVSTPGSQIVACTNWGVEEAHVPPTTFDPDGHDAVHDELAAAPELLGPVHEA